MLYQFMAVPYPYPCIRRLPEQQRIQPVDLRPWTFIKVSSFVYSILTYPFRFPDNAPCMTASGTVLHGLIVC